MAQVDVNNIEDPLNQLLKPTDVERLDKYIGLRDKMIDKMFENGDVPYKTSDMRVVNEIIGSNEASILEQAKLRKELGDSENDELFRQNAVAMIAEIAKQKRDVIDTSGEYVEPVIEIPADIVDGELDINPGKLSPEDYVRGEDV